MIRVSPIRTDGLLTSYHRTSAANVLWSPLKISGLLAWYRPESLSGYADTQVVSRWSDESGNDVHLDTIGTGVTLKTAQKNGRDVVHFNGASLLKTVPDMIGSGSQELSIYCGGLRATSLATYPIVMQVSATHSSAADGFTGLLFADGSIYAGGCLDNNTRRTSAGDVVTATWYRLTWEASTSAFSSTNPVVYKNGTDTARANGSGTSAVSFASGCTATVGASHYNGVYNNYYTGDIGEIIVVNRVLSSFERGLIDTYLAARWD